MSTLPPINKIKWSCRRGMLELDLLLTPFLEEYYPKLSHHQQVTFVALLNYSDPELQEWLFTQVQPHDEDLIEMVNLIKNHARNRFSY